ncbi:MAG: ChaN family lipoprotein [Bacteroidales bacterium]|nr:ChaN family lipoprotein [Bacteroidales bacterium]
MNRFFFLLSALSFFIFLQACTVSKLNVNNNSIQPRNPRQDPLIGKIIDAHTQKSIDFKQLIQGIKNSDIIYLSEKHDNPDQHAFQNKVIKALLDDQLKPTIGFEFFAMESTPDLLNFIDSANVVHSKKAEETIAKDLRKKLGWDSQSDKMWAYYFELLSLAREKKLLTAGIDLPKTLKKRITRKGLNGLSPLEKEQLFSTHLKDNAYKDYMSDIFKVVNCGMGQGKMQSKLYDTWVARNDRMALSITQLNKHKKGPVVIILGGGHTEYGLGVMDRVKAIDPDIKQVNIGLKEIYVHPAKLADYLDPLTLEGHEKTLPADYLYFSQRVSYDDSCEKFKSQLKKMKRKAQE